MNKWGGLNNSPHFYIGGDYMAIYCPNGLLKKEGTKQWIECRKTNRICSFQRYCIHDKKVVNTIEANKCKLRN